MTLITAKGGCLSGNCKVFAKVIMIGYGHHRQVVSVKTDLLGDFHYKPSVRGIIIKVEHVV